MLRRNTMQYGQDSFEFRRQGLLKSRAPLDFTYETSIERLEISGTEPEGSTRRIIFEIDGRLYRFVNGILDAYDERGEFADIITEGNTVGELLALSADSLASFVGKKVLPTIALDAPADSPVMPRIKISARVKSYNDVYAKTEYSPIYELKCSGDACKIVDISASKTLNGYGTASVKCKLENPLTGWSDDWINLEDTRYQLANAVQFRIDYLVTTLDGSDFAQVRSITVNYTTDTEKLSGDFMEIVTAPQEYYSDLGTCYALIKHSELIDCDLKAFVSFSAPLEHREVVIGNGTGEEQTFALVHNASIERNIVADTLRMTYDGKPLPDFHFDTANATVTFTAPFGTKVEASYDAGAHDDNWREMAFDFTAESEGTFSSRFTYQLDDTTNRRVSSVKFRFERKAGRVENERLGIGTGREQIFVLPHRAIAETIKCTGGWKYDEDAQILKVLADLDDDITVNYSWAGAAAAVKEYAVGWLAKV